MPIGFSRFAPVRNEDSLILLFNGYRHGILAFHFKPLVEKSIKLLEKAETEHGRERQR